MGYSLFLPPGGGCKRPKYSPMIKKRWKFMARFPAKIQKVLKNARFRTLWMNQIFSKIGLRHLKSLIVS